MLSIKSCSLWFWQEVDDIWAQQPIKSNWHCFRMLHLVSKLALFLIFYYLFSFLFLWRGVCVCVCVLCFKETQHERFLTQGGLQWAHLPCSRGWSFWKPPLYSTWYFFTWNPGTHSPGPASSAPTHTACKRRERDHLKVSLIITQYFYHKHRMCPAVRSGLDRARFQPINNAFFFRRGVFDWLSI